MSLTRRPMVRLKGGGVAAVFAEPSSETKLVGERGEYLEYRWGDVRQRTSPLQARRLP